MYIVSSMDTERCVLNTQGYHMSRSATKLQKCCPVAGEGCKLINVIQGPGRQTKAHMQVGREGSIHARIPLARLVTSTCGSDASPMPASSMSGATCGCVFVSSTNMFVSTWISLESIWDAWVLIFSAHHVHLPPIGFHSGSNEAIEKKTST